MAFISHQMPKQVAFNEALARRKELTLIQHKDAPLTQPIIQPIWTDSRYAHR